MPELYSILQKKTNVGPIYKKFHVRPLMSALLKKFEILIATFKSIVQKDP